MIEPNLLFSSNFGENVVVDVPYSENGVWLQKISGVDNTTNYCWIFDFPGDSTSNHLSYNVNSDKVLDEYVITTIETILDNDGNEIKALHQVVQKDDVDNANITRSQFNAFPVDDETIGNLKHIYMKYDIKLQENLNDILSQRILMEWNNVEQHRSS